MSLTAVRLVAAALVALGPVAGIPLDARPFGAAASADGTLLVTRLDAARVSVVDLRRRTVTADIDVGSVPTGVTFDASGGRAYVTNQHDGTIGVIDVRAGRQVAQLAVGGHPFVARVAPGGRTLYVGRAPDRLAVVELPRGRVRRLLQVGYTPNGMDFHPDGGRLFVSTASSALLVQVDTRSDSVVGTVGLGGMPQEVLVSPGGCELYVANEHGWVDVVDPHSGERVARIALAGGGFGLALAGDGVTLYVSVPSRGLVQVIDTRARRVVRDIEVGGVPRRLVIDARSGGLAVANEAGRVDFVR